ncbi:MAG: hypothetical protein IKK26_00855, partial [Clostridia bacterium]|nr:hypothetical protein [Clostridia bacterium]
MQDKYLDILNSRLTFAITDTILHFIISIIGFILIIVFGYFAFKKRQKVQTSKSGKIYKVKTGKADKAIKIANKFLFFASVFSTCLSVLFVCYHLKLSINLRYDIDNKSFCTVTGYCDDEDYNTAWLSTTVVDNSGNRIKVLNGVFETFTIAEEPPITFVYGEKSKVVVDVRKTRDGTISFEKS